MDSAPEPGLQLHVVEEIRLRVYLLVHISGSTSSLTLITSIGAAAKYTGRCAVV